MLPWRVEGKSKFAVQSRWNLDSPFVSSNRPPPSTESRRQDEKAISRDGSPDRTRTQIRQTETRRKLHDSDIGGDHRDDPRRIASSRQSGVRISRGLLHASGFRPQDNRDGHGDFVAETPLRPAAKRKRPYRPLTWRTYHGFANLPFGMVTTASPICDSMVGLIDGLTQLERRIRHDVPTTRRAPLRIP